MAKNKNKYLLQTKEEKDLLLKDLCARSPYGFIVHRYSDNADIRIDSVSTFGHFLEYSEGEDFKPYLRPMSSMTEKESNEYRMFIDYSYNDFTSESTPCVYVDKINEYLDWLNEHHFDYRGLIEKGLALQAPEGMYNLSEK